MPVLPARPPAGRVRHDPNLTAASAIGVRARYVCPVPVWLSEQEYAVLRAACAQMMPSDQGAPGADEAGVADYIDTFLGAFTFDPPRIWAGGPTSGRMGGVAGFADFHPLSRLDELAWRTRIEGSQGLPEREFNGPVVGLQQRYREGLAALGADFAEVDGQRAAPPPARPTRPSATCCGSTAARACTGRPSTGATATGSGGPTSSTRATCSRGATATPRCPSRDRRRASSSGRARAGRPRPRC